MDMQTRGEWFRSDEMTFSAGGKKTFDLSFLHAARGKYEYPVIDQLEIVGDLNVGDATSAALAGEDGKRMLDRVLIRDGAGVRCNLTGAMVGEVEQLEFGGAYNGPATLAESTTDSDYEVSWRIPFNIPNLARRGNDTSLPLGHLLRGGRVEVTMANSVNGTANYVNSGNLHLRALVRDDGRPEAKSRLVWDFLDVEKADTTYSINGLLRALWFSFQDEDGSGLNDASTITELDSKTLDIYDRLVSDHINDYRAVQRDRDAGDLFLQAATARNIPIVWPYEGQAMGRMLDIAAIHLKQDVSPITDQKLVFCKIEDRDARLTAAHFNMSEDAYLDAIRNGVVVSAKGKHAPVGLVGEALANKLPLRLA